MQKEPQQSDSAGDRNRDQRCLEVNRLLFQEGTGLEVNIEIESVTVLEFVVLL